MPRACPRCRTEGMERYEDSMGHLMGSRYFPSTKWYCPNCSHSVMLVPAALTVPIAVVAPMVTLYSVYALFLADPATVFDPAGSFKAYTADDAVWMMVLGLALWAFSWVHAWRLRHYPRSK